MFQQIGANVALSGWTLLLASPLATASDRASPAATVEQPPGDVERQGLPHAIAAAATAPRGPPSAQQALDRGVLIVVSLPAQRAFVFRDGYPWGSARVSTGRRGHHTPAGLFPILQKSVAHRSTLYRDAPMPYMQRLTWSGVALHGGNVSRYRASHGCIRLPHAFARSLFKITAYRSTAVLVTRSRVASSARAVALVSGGAVPTASATPEIARSQASPRPLRLDSGTQIIQLAALHSADKAAALWDQLVKRQPRLAQLKHQIVLAKVDARTVYRLRAFGPGAAAVCHMAINAGMDCFEVVS